MQSLRNEIHILREQLRHSATKLAAWEGWYKKEGSQSSLLNSSSTEPIRKEERDLPPSPLPGGIPSEGIERKRLCHPSALPDKHVGFSCSAAPATAFPSPSSLTPPPLLTSSIPFHNEGRVTHTTKELCSSPAAVSGESEQATRSETANAAGVGGASSSYGNNADATGKHKDFTSSLVSNAIPHPNITHHHPHHHYPVPQLNELERRNRNENTEGNREENVKTIPLLPERGLSSFPSSKNMGICNGKYSCATSSGEMSLASKQRMIERGGGWSGGELKGKYFYTQEEEDVAVAIAKGRAIRELALEELERRA